MAWPTVRAKAPPPPAGSRAKAPKGAQRKQARVLYLRARKKYNLGQFRSARKDFIRAYDLLPLPGFLFNIAQCHRYLGDHLKAVHLYQAYLRDNPGSPNTAAVETLIRLSQAALANKQQRRGRAKKAFTEGLRLYKLGQFEPAIVRFMAAYKIAPLAGYLFMLGQAHRQLGRYKKAVYFYKGYLRDNPGTPESKSVEELITRSERLHRERLAAIRKGLVRPKGPHRPGGIPTLPGGGAVKKTKPYYKTWWFWTAIGAGVAVLVSGLAGGLSASGGFQVPPSDYQITMR